MLWWPLSSAVRRRLRALGIAVAVHAGFVAIALFSQNEYFDNLPKFPDSVDVVFITAPEPDLSPPPVPEPEPEVAPPEAAALAPPVSDTPALPEPILPTAPIAAVTDEDEAETPPRMTNLDRLQSYEVQPFFIAPPPGSTAQVLRSVFCSTTPNATRDAADCDYSEHDPTALLQYAQTHDLAALNAAFGLDLTPDQIRVLNGIAPNELAGQPTMDTADRPTSSADEMRDTLPPQVVDPSFGD